MRKLFYSLLAIILMMFVQNASAQSRRPIDNRHPMWMIHIDVWNNADPQKIIDLIPADIKPYVCLNLSLSCSYDTTKNRYKKPQNAVQTYRSWAAVCCRNNMWFTCQPASGGHTHIPDNPENFNKALEIHESFFKDYPNFLGWNYAEQFWGFNEGYKDKSSSSDTDRIALFAALVPMHHKYGGFLTISFCGNIWSHPVNPVGMMKRNGNLLNACRQYPEAILWLYKYTTSANWYNNESVSMGPFISGLAKNYGVRYDNCGWNGAIDEFVKNGKELHGDGLSERYPGAVGIAPVLEQTALNGACVWDGPELIWTECFRGLNNSNVDGYTRRNWGTYSNFDNIWVDMFRKMIDGTIHIPSREEVLARTKVVIKNDISQNNDGTSLKVNAYAAPVDLYHGLYWQNDPFNARTSNESGIGNIAGYANNNYLYFKRTGRYATIPVVIDLYDDKAKSAGITVINRSEYNSKYQNRQSDKVNLFNQKYPDPVIEAGDLFVGRHKNALVCYFPFSDHKRENGNLKTTSYGKIPLKFNKCTNMELTLGLFSSVHAKEYSDHIDFYLNNFNERESREVRTDVIKINGASSKPSFNVTSNRCNAEVTENWSNGVYTVNVKHCGPLDLRINCSGNNNRNGGATVDDTPLSAASVAQPVKSQLVGQPLIIEGEDFDFKNIARNVTDAWGDNWGAYQDVLGHAAMGFIDMGTNTQASLRTYPKVSVDDTYEVSVRYLAIESGAITVNVNGTEARLNTEKTANSFTNSNSWRTVSMKARMTTSQNTVTITNVGGKNMYIDQVIFTPQNYKPVAGGEGSNTEGTKWLVPTKYYAPANLSNPTVEGDQNAEYKNGKYYYHYQYSSAFSFYDFQGIRVKDLGSLSINCAAESTCGYRLDFILTDEAGNEVLVQGSENTGTRFTTPQTEQIFDLTSLLSSYQDYKLDHIRLNTSISADQVANDHDSYFLKVNSLVLGTNTLSTPRKSLTSLSKIDFSTWTAPSNGTVTETWPNTAALNKALNGGDIIYGENEVGYLNYGDLTGYKYMTIYGTPGKTIRVLMNRKVNEGKVEDGNLTEVAVVLNEVGLGTVDLTPYQYVHLNAIKPAWGNDNTTINSIVLVQEGVEPEPVKTASLGDFDFCSWTAPNNGIVTEVWDNTLALNTPLNGGDIIFGEEKVGYLNYADVSAYKAMTISGTPGKTIRVLFNRLEDEGSVADGKMEEVDVLLNEQGKATVDFRFYPFVHINAIKPAWGNDGVTITAIDLVEKTEEEASTTIDGLEYCEWTSANGTKVGPANSNLTLGVEMNNYGLVYGSESVSEKFYADISDYEVLALTGTPNKTIRVLLNATATDRVEVNPTFDANGFAAVNLTAYPYAHLNAIKVAWGDDVNTAVNSIRLMSESEYSDFVLSQAFASKVDYSEILTAIEKPNASSTNAVVVARYTINGTQIFAPVRGLNILRMSDGSVRKVMIK